MHPDIWVSILTQSLNLGASLIMRTFINVQPWGYFAKTAVSRTRRHSVCSFSFSTGFASLNAGRHICLFYNFKHSIGQKPTGCISLCFPSIKSDLWLCTIQHHFNERWQSKHKQFYKPEWVRRGCPGLLWGTPGPTRGCHPFFSLYSHRLQGEEGRLYGGCTTESPVGILNTL